MSYFNNPVNPLLYVLRSDHVLLILDVLFKDKSVLASYVTCMYPIYLIYATVVVVIIWETVNTSFHPAN